MELNEKQLEMCESSRWDFSDLHALFLNCTLKKSPELSHTQGLVEISKAIMEKNGVSVEVVRPVDHNIAYGVYPDMKEQGWEQDDWPKLYEKVKVAEILVITSPIWLGEKSSVCTKTIERLYSNSGDLKENGQYIYYGRAGGCLITGNEDGGQALFHEHSLFPPASRIRHPASSRCRLAGTGRTGTLISGSRIGRARE